MKRKIIFSLLLTAFFVLSAPSAYAAEVDISDIYSEQLEQSEAEGLPDELPDETREYMDDMGLSPGECSADISQLFEKIVSVAKASAGSTAGAFGCIIGLIFASSMLHAVLDSSKAPTMSKAMSAACSAGICLSASVPVAVYITQASEAVRQCCSFDEIFIPVYSAISAAAGKPASAAKYGAAMMIILECAAQLTDKAVLPLLRVVLAFSIAGSLAPSLRLDSVISLLDKYLKWALGFISVLIAGVISIGSVSSKAMDGLTGRAVKYVFSSTVPVVGGALGDALSTVTGCAELLRASVGSYGMIAMAFILIPPLIKGAVWRFCASCSSLLAELLGVKEAKRLCDSIGGAISIMNAIIIFTGILTVFTLAVSLGAAG